MRVNVTAPRSARKPIITLLAAVVSRSPARETLVASYLADLEQQTALPSAEVLFLSATPVDAEGPALRASMRAHPNYGHVYFPRDPGLYGMWNYAWQHVARGEFLTNLNLDDRLAHHALQTKLSALRARPECDILSCGVVFTPPRTDGSPALPFTQARARAAQLVEASETLQRTGGLTYVMQHDGSGASRSAMFWSVVDMFSYSWDVRNHSWGDLPTPFVPDDAIAAANPPHNSPVWRASLRRMGEFDSRFDPASDWELWLRLMCATPRAQVCHVNEVLQTYENNPNSYGNSKMGQRGAAMRLVGRVLGTEASPGPFRRCLEDDLAMRQPEPGTPVQELLMWQCRTARGVFGGDWRDERNLCARQGELHDKHVLAMQRAELRRHKKELKAHMQTVANAQSQIAQLQQKNRAPLKLLRSIREVKAEAEAQIQPLEERIARLRCEMESIIARRMNTTMPQDGNAPCPAASPAADYELSRAITVGA